ncbi:MAG: C40 family peptidase [Burkholderiaceae bacterium]
MQQTAINPSKTTALRTRATTVLAQITAATLIATTPAQTAGALEVGRGPSLRSDIVVRALTLLDTPYRYGGTTPQGGFDCSGLVRYVYNAVGAAELPRRSEDIGKVGDPISRSQLEPGDLVFFNTLARAYSHVAIYIGEGRFLHAPARGGKVRIEALDDRYWQARFDGARRLIDAPSAVAGIAPLRVTRPPTIESLFDNLTVKP